MTSLKSKFSDKHILLLDAAMGTALTACGQKTDLPLWSAWSLIENPQAVLTIHLDHLKAGAELITTNTFRTQAYCLNKINRSELSKQLTTRAVKLAKKAQKQVKTKSWILGSMAPLEDCYQPHLAPNHSICWREHRQHAHFLKEAGVDGLILETFSHPREIRAAFYAAKATGLPFILSLVCDPHSKTLFGDKIKKFVHTFERDVGCPDVWGLNCLTPNEITKVHCDLSQATQQPTAVWAHVGHQQEGKWLESGLVSAQKYAQQACQWVKQGASVIGGCCGTDANFIKEIKNALI